MFHFPFYGEPEHNHAIEAAVDKMIQLNIARLEEEAAIFVKMGFKFDELAVIRQDGMPDGVFPKMAFGIED